MDSQDKNSGKLDQQQNGLGERREDAVGPYDHTAEDGSQMSFLDHLEELRWHIVRSISAIL
ncbi:MAG: hypothetical protein ACLFT3_13450, partial [Cyclobacteriaceae bacterium]